MIFLFGISSKPIALILSSTTVPIFSISTFISSLMGDFSDNSTPSTGQKPFVSDSWLHLVHLNFFMLVIVIGNADNLLRSPIHISKRYAERFVYCCEHAPFE